eukprot:jgi/Mesvir1/12209/Mv00438-RA.1
MQASGSRGQDPSQGQGLERYVLQMTLQDLQTESQIAGPIPGMFPDLPNYLHAFRSPLIDEVRAQLARGLASLADVPPLALTVDKFTPWRESKGSSNADSSPPAHFWRLSGLVMDPDQSHGVGWDPRQTTATRLPPPASARIKPYDVAVISERTVASVQELQPVAHALLMVASVPDDGVGDVGKSISCMVYARDGSDEADVFRSSRESKKCWHLYIIGSLATGLRVHKGPPGTGKTSTACCLLRVLVALRARVMACAPTNVAVQEVATRLLRSVGSRTEHRNTANESSASVGRRGDVWGAGIMMELASAGFVPATPRGMRLRLADIVLVGTPDKVDVEGDMGRIYLPERLKRLRACFGIQHGFASTAQRCAELLGALQERHREAVQTIDTEKMQANGASIDRSSDYIPPGASASQVLGQPITSRGAFLRDQLSALLESLCEHGGVILEEAPCTEQARDWLSSMLSRASQLLHQLSLEGTGVLDAVFDSLVDTTRETQDMNDHAMGAHDRHAMMRVNDDTTCPPTREGMHAASYAAVGHGSRPILLGSGGRAHSSSDTLVKSIEGFRRDVGDQGLLAMLPGGGRVCPGEEAVLRGARVLFCTVSSAGRPSLQQQAGVFHTVVVDEAAQLVEAETSIILTSSATTGMAQLVLVGDPMQLPATVLSLHARRCGYAQSLFERVQSKGWPSLLLDTQYRMHPDISRWPNLAFYDGRIEDAPCVSSPEFHRLHDTWRARVLQGPPTAFAFINVHMGGEEREVTSGSFFNRLEEVVVRGLVHKVVQSGVSRRRSLSIGVISPYKAQVLRIETELSAVEVVDVHTVDGFQGQERDIIIISAVRANTSGDVGFLSDFRRLNVAITRAKHMCIVLGNVDTLRHDATWRRLIEHARQRGLLRSGAEDEDLMRWCRRFLAQQNQMRLLLQPGSSMYASCLWKFVLSAEFVRHVQLLDRDLRVETMHRLYSLAAGRWPKDTWRVTQVSRAFQDVIGVVKVATFCVLWSVDLDTSAAAPQQKMRVWDVMHQSRLATWLKKLEQRYLVYTERYLTACIPQAPSGRPPTVLPRYFTPEEVLLMRASPAGLSGQVAHAQAPPAPLEQSDIESSLSLMKFFTPLPTAVSKWLRSDASPSRACSAAGSDFELPLDVSETEADIINYPCSCFILGRSGTGKTTVITQKLLLRDIWNAALLGVGGANEAAVYHSSLGGQGHPGEGEAGPSEGGKGLADRAGGGERPMALRQLVLTVSPKLCSAIKRQLLRAKATHGGGGGEEEEEEEIMLDEDDEERLMGGIPDNLAAIRDDQCPLVVTFAKVLAILDGTLPVSFWASHGRQSREGGEGRHVPGIGPWAERYGLHHQAGGAMYTSTGTRREGRCMGRGAEVTFELFAAHYWPHLNQQLTRRLEAAAVWMEIHTHIKGSVDALHDPKGRLSRDQYVALARRRVSTLDEPQREDVYSLFLSYEAMKRERGQHDVADVVFYVHSRFARGEANVPRSSLMHFVYVDEVQDLCPAQIALLRFVCANVETGFVFAGDTAQTIAKGVGFRFQDIRALFYTEFLRQLESRGARGSCAEEGGRMPDMFQLAQNFRTHQGVVSLAASIVNMLLHYFPATMDRLAPECAVVDGEAPVFLEVEPAEAEGGREDFIAATFGKANLSGTTYEFGADQVIIVPDLEAKARVKSQVGKGALVLTALESKGLEFKDVLVLDFFHRSPLGAQWRVLYDYMKECGDLPMESGEIQAPRFDATRHAALCPELKKLYVVSTRARQKLAFYDADATNRAPMHALWAQRGLIRTLPVRQLTEYMQSQQNTPQDWLRQGEALFGGKKYEDAILCFQRAGDKPREMWAEAALAQQQADNLTGFAGTDDTLGMSRSGHMSASDKHARELYRAAKGTYLAVARLLPKSAPKLWDKAIACCSKAGDVDLLVRICLDVCVPRRPVLAAEHLERAGLMKKAFDLYADTAWATADLALLSRALGCCVASRPPAQEKRESGASRAAMDRPEYRDMLLLGIKELERYSVAVEEVASDSPMGHDHASGGGSAGGGVGGSGGGNAGGSVSSAGHHTSSSAVSGEEAVPERWDQLGAAGPSCGSSEPQAGLDNGRVVVPPAASESFLRVRADYARHCALVFKSGAGAKGGDPLRRLLPWFPSYQSRRDFLRRYQLVESLVQLEIAQGHLEDAARLCEGSGKPEEACDLYRRAGRWQQASRSMLRGIHTLLLWGPGSYHRASRGRTEDLPGPHHHPQADAGFYCHPFKVDEGRRGDLDAAVTALVRLKEEAISKLAAGAAKDAGWEALVLEIDVLLARARWELGGHDEEVGGEGHERVGTLWDRASATKRSDLLMLLGVCLLDHAVHEFRAAISGALAGLPVASPWFASPVVSGRTSVSPVSSSENEAMAGQDIATLALTKAWHAWAHFVGGVVQALDRQTSRARTGSREGDAELLAANERYLEAWPHPVHSDYYVVPAHAEDIPWLNQGQTIPLEPLAGQPQRALLHRGVFCQRAADFWRGLLTSGSRHCLTVVRSILSTGGPFAVTPMNAQSYRKVTACGFRAERVVPSRYATFAHLGLWEFGTVARTPGRLRMLLLCRQVTSLLLEVQRDRLAGTVGTKPGASDMSADDAMHWAVGEAALEAAVLPPLASLEQQGAALGLLHASCGGQAANGRPSSSPEESTGVNVSSASPEDRPCGSDPSKAVSTPLPTSLPNIIGSDRADAGGPVRYRDILRGIVDEHLRLRLNGTGLAQGMSQPISRPGSLDAVARVILSLPGHLDGPTWLPMAVQLGILTKGSPYQVRARWQPGHVEVADLRLLMIEAAKHEVAAARGLAGAMTGYEHSHVGATECGLTACLYAYDRLNWRMTPGYFSPLVFVAMLETYVVMACALCTGFDGLILPAPLAVSAMAGREAIYSVALRRGMSQQQAARTRDLLSCVLRIILLPMLTQDCGPTSEWLRSHHQGPPGSTSVNAGDRGGKYGDGSPTVTAPGMGSPIQGPAEVDGAVILRVITLVLVIGVNAKRAGLTAVEGDIVDALPRFVAFRNPLSRLPPEAFMAGLRGLKAQSLCRPRQSFSNMFCIEGMKLLRERGGAVLLLCRKTGQTSGWLPEPILMLGRAVVETPEGLFQLPPLLVPPCERLQGEDSGALGQTTHAGPAVQDAGAPDAAAVPVMSDAGMDAEGDAEIGPPETDEPEHVLDVYGNMPGEGFSSNQAGSADMPAPSELAGGLESSADETGAGEEGDEDEGVTARGGLDLSVLEGQAAAPAVGERFWLPPSCVDRLLVLLARARDRLALPLTAQQRLERAAEVTKRKLIRLSSEGAAGEEEVGQSQVVEVVGYQGGREGIKPASAERSKIAFYMSVVVSDVCPLLADAEETLLVVSSLVMKLSERNANEMVVDALYDHEEQLKGFLSETGDGLSPSNEERHAVCSLPWLQTRAQELKAILVHVKKAMQRAAAETLGKQGLERIKTGLGLVSVSPLHGPACLGGGRP